MSKGTYLIQIKTNDVGNDVASGHNRFSLRAYGSSGSDKDHISISGYAKMAMYGNTPNGTSKFYLAKVPTGSRGQLFTVRLFDIGDGATPGSTVKVMPPVEYGDTFTGVSGQRRPERGADRLHDQRQLQLQRQLAGRHGAHPLGLLVPGRFADRVLAAPRVLLRPGFQPR